MDEVEKGKITVKAGHKHRVKPSWVLGPSHIASFTASFTRILFAVALLLADTAFAQPAKKTNEENAKGFIDVLKDGVERYEDGVKRYDGIYQAHSLAFQCTEVVAHIQKLEDQLEQWKTINDKFMTPLGTALTVTKASIEMYKGQPIQGIQTAGMALLDIQICKAFTKARGPAEGGALCAAWQAGRAAGDFVDKAPQWFGWTNATLNEMWTDLLASWAYPDPTPEDFQKLYDLAQQKQRELRALMESQQREKVRCEAKDDNIKGGIQQALDGALSRARQRSSEIPRENDSTAGGGSDAGPVLPSFEIEPRRSEGMSPPPVFTVPRAAVKQPRQRPTSPTSGTVGSGTGSSSHPTSASKIPKTDRPPCRNPELACLANDSECRARLSSLPLCGR